MVDEVIEAGAAGLPREPMVVGGNELWTLVEMLQSGKASGEVINAAVNALLATAGPALDAGAVFGPDRKMDGQWLTLLQASEIVSKVVRDPGDPPYTMQAMKWRCIPPQEHCRSYMTPYGRLIHFSDLIAFIRQYYPERRKVLEALL